MSKAWQGLGAWVGSRVALLVAVVAAWQLSANRQLLGGWDSWDVTLFRKIAEFGYDGYPTHYPDQNVAAFFPGFPLVLRAAHLVVPDWTAAGLLVSFVAGAVAVVALARLSGLAGVDGSRAVLYLVASPYAVFLAAGYSESLFLAFASPAGWPGAASAGPPPGCWSGARAWSGSTGPSLRSRWSCCS